MKLSKLKSYSATLAESSGCFTAVGSILVFVAASQWMYRLMEYVVINHLYGHAAWAEGLRVIDNKGNLSSGDFLVGWPLIALYLGSFVLTVPFFLGSSVLFSYVGLRLRGRRLSDPKPKKKWKSSGESDHAA